MQLYLSSSRDFISDTKEGRLAEKLKNAFMNNFRHHPSSAEVNSWQVGLIRLAWLLEEDSLLDLGILLEYQLPNTSKRVDCIIAGLDLAGNPNAIIIEVKGWSDVFESDVEDCVATNIGGRRRDVLHPSKQVSNYQEYLEDFLPNIGSREIRFSSCCFLPIIQYQSNNPLLGSRFSQLLELSPIFMGDQIREFAHFLKTHAGQGHGLEVATAIVDAAPTESNKLLESIKAVVTGDRPFILLDEQQLAYNEIHTRTLSNINNKEKAVFFIKGGPGSGKSLIAIKLLMEFSAHSLNVQYISTSHVFTESMRKHLGSNYDPLFRYFNKYTHVPPNSIDVLIIDDVHRLRPHSHNQYISSSARSGFSQAKELIEAAKTTVFFVDERQVIQPSAVGNAETIREAASALGANFYHYELKGQFRFDGSNEFLNWVDNTLGIRKTETAVWRGTNAYDFRIANSPAELESLIRAKNEAGYPSRITAGLCWPWSKPDEAGLLPCDIVVGDWTMPWVAHPESSTLAEGIPKATEWAVDPAGINQVGNIYTVQGFEFDYVGLIFGRDLRYDPVKDLWLGDKSQSHDETVKRSKDEFIELARNTYRVLLTRGLKGCYIYFLDKDTRKFFESRMSQ